MRSQPWYRSWLTVGTASLLLPPVGLALLWVRSGTRLSKKLFGSLAIVALTVVYLYTFFGLRVEVDGSGMRPLVSFYDPEAHFSALEQNRAQQSDLPPQARANTARREEREAASTDDREARLGLESRASEEAALPDARAETPTSTSRYGLGAYWTDFRGPDRDGRYDEADILTSWPAEGLPMLWRQPIGGGYASFVVADDRAFTIEQRRQQEVVAAYDLETGRELWTHGWDGYFTEMMGGDGPRATPTWDDGRVYALGAAGEFRCLNAETGTLIWKRNILSDNGAPNLQWAMSAAPLIVDDKVIVLPGGSSGNSVVAYDKLSGEPVWSSLDDEQAYTSPMLVTLAGRRQILVVSALRAMGLAVEDGSLLWDYPWTISNVPNISQPILLGRDRVFLSASYGKGAAVFEVSSSDRGFAAQTVWTSNRMKNKFSSSVLHDGYLYGLDEAILACVDAETGELKWKGGRYGYGQVVLASGHLIVLTESGDVVLVRATPERHDELARFSAITGKTWNCPVIAGGRLLVRNATEMACFDISAGPP